MEMLGCWRKSLGQCVSHDPAIPTVATRTKLVVVAVVVRSHLLNQSRLIALLSTPERVWNLDFELCAHFVLGTCPQSERGTV